MVEVGLCIIYLDYLKEEPFSVIVYRLNKCLETFNWELEVTFLFSIQDMPRAVSSIKIQHSKSPFLSPGFN